MSFKLNVKTDVRQVRRMLSKAQRSLLPKAVAFALNKTIRPVHSAAIKLIAQDLGIKQKIVRKNLIVRRATWKKWQSSVAASGRRIPLTALGAKESHGGVTYKGKGGGRRIVKNAFIATMKSGHVGVVKRMGKKRLPIRELFGVSIPHVFVHKRLQSAMQAVGQKRWKKNFEREVNFRLKKAGYSKRIGL